MAWPRTRDCLQALVPLRRHRPPAPNAMQPHTRMQRTRTHPFLSAPWAPPPRSARARPPRPTGPNGSPPPSRWPERHHRHTHAMHRHLYRMQHTRLHQMRVWHRRRALRCALCRLQRQRSPRACRPPPPPAVRLLLTPPSHAHLVVALSVRRAESPLPNAWRASCASAQSWCMASARAFATRRPPTASAMHWSLSNNSCPCRLADCCTTSPSSGGHRAGSLTNLAHAAPTGLSFESGSVAASAARRHRCCAPWSVCPYCRPRTTTRS